MLSVFWTFKKSFPAGLQRYDLRLGMTVLEIIIIVAIITLITGLGVTSFVKTMDSYSLSGDVQLIEEGITFARTKTLARENAQKYSIRLNSESLTMYEGGVWNPSASTNVTIPLSGRNLISTASTTGGNTIIFDIFTGTSSSSGTIKVTSKRTGEVRNIELLSTGIPRRT